MGSSPTSIFIATGVAVAFTFVWLVVVVWTGLRYARIQEGEPVAKPALVLWALSLGGAFTGPCAFLFALAGVVGGLWMYKRTPDASERTRAAAVGAAASGAVLLLMIALMVLIMAIGGALST